MRNSRKKWTRTFLIVIFFAILTSLIYINHIEAPLDLAKHRAIRLAKKKEDLVNVQRVVFSAYEKKHTIIFGQDSYGKDEVIWVTGKKVHAEYTELNTTEKYIRNKLLKTYPKAQITRVVPVIWRDIYAWEVYFQAQPGEHVRKQYNYYQFSDGKLLASYLLHL
jgi:uncharacterized protein YpmB